MLTTILTHHGKILGKWAHFAVESGQILKKIIQPSGHTGWEGHLRTSKWGDEKFLKMTLWPDIDEGKNERSENWRELSKWQKRSFVITTKNITKLMADDAFLFPPPPKNGQFPTSFSLLSSFLGTQFAGNKYNWIRTVDPWVSNWSGLPCRWVLGWSKWFNELMTIWSLWEPN